MQSRLTVRADAGAMNFVKEFVAAFVAEHGLDGDDAARVLILLEELLTNLQKYGYPDRSEPGEAEITLGLEGTRLTIEFTDDGRAFDPLARPAHDPDQSIEARPIGGLGLHILRALTDEARYTRANDRNVIRLTRRLSVRNRR